MAALEGESYRPAFPSLTHLDYPAYVSSGADFDQACAHHINQTLGAHRVYIVASRSHLLNTEDIRKLEQALGDRHVATWPGFSAHTPWDEVLDATKDAMQKEADCIVAIGAVGLIDGAKAMLLFLANKILRSKSYASSKPKGLIPRKDCCLPVHTLRASQSRKYRVPARASH